MSVLALRSGCFGRCVRRPLVEGNSPNKGESLKLKMSANDDHVQAAAAYMLHRRRGGATSAPAKLGVYETSSGAVYTVSEDAVSRAGSRLPNVAESEVWHGASAHVLSLSDGSRRLVVFRTSGGDVTSSPLARTPQ